MSQPTTSQPPKSKGFLASLTAGLNTIVNEVERTITKTSEELNKAWSDATDERFRKAFKFPLEERLIGEFWGQCISGGTTNSCACFVSTNYFSFTVDLPSGKACVTIPLRDIVNVQQAVTLRTTGSAPVLQPVNDSRTKVDAFQIYTNDMKLHQFFSFLQYDKAYHSLLHAWRAIQAPQTYASQSYVPSPYSGQSNQTMAQAGVIQLDNSQPSLYSSATTPSSYLQPFSPPHPSQQFPTSQPQQFPPTSQASNNTVQYTTTL
jgi:hypothetical protein